MREMDVVVHTDFLDMFRKSNYIDDDFCNNS